MWEQQPLTTRPSRTARRRLPGTCALAVFLAAVQGVGALQNAGSITGWVLDEQSLDPVSGALVALPGFAHHRTRTDADGWFRILNVPSGEVVMRVEGDGFGTLVETVEVAPMEESLVRLHMHRVSLVLDQLLVEVPRLDDLGRGHSEARVDGTGAGSRTAADLLATGVPGVTVQQPQGGVGAGVRIRLRGVNSFLLGEEPQIFLDGVRIDAGGQDRAMLTLDRIPASSVTRIRVLRGPASTSRYPGAAAGIVLVETMNRGG